MILLFEGCKKKDDTMPANSNNSNSSASWEPTMNGFGSGISPYGVIGLNNKMAAITDYGGVYLSSDNGSSWVHSPNINLPLDNTGGGTNYSSFSGFGNYLFIGKTSSGIYKSTNDASSWSTLNGLNYSSRTGLFQTDGTNIFCLNGNTIYKSDLSASSWSLSNSGLPNGSSANAISTFKISPYIFIAGTINPADIYISYNNGSSWNFISEIPNAGLISSVEIVNSLIYVGTNSGLFVSNDGGASWALVHGGLPSSLYVTSMSSNGNKLILTGIGATDVYESIDGGINWLSAINGLPGFGILGSVSIVGNYAFLRASNKLYRKSL